MEENNLYENSNKKNSKKKSNKGIIVLALVFSLIGGVIGSAITNALQKENVNSANNTNPVVINSKDSLNVASAVAKKATPSVVGITTKGLVDNGFFGPVEASGTGSGIIVDEKGYILTNAHVVKISGQVVKECTVILDNGSSINGEPIWVDSGIDIAIVKIDPKGEKLQKASLGDSSKLEIGETAIAIGNPIDIAFQRSVTQGIISGLDRYVGQVNGGGYMTGLIQTDASINGGNSGGPLLNSKGEVIGINTVKLSTAEGLGFSIPINYVKPIVEQVIKTGDYKVVSMGILSVDVQAASRLFNVDINTEQGVFVVESYENSPAALAGIKVGDIITKIGQDDVTTTDSLKAILYKYKAGDSVEVKIIRDGKESSVNVKFTEYSVGDDKNAQKRIYQDNGR
ncbi:MAG: S1C family serine protease [Peptoniphilaceae bacterium]